MMGMSLSMLANSTLAIVGFAAVCIFPRSLAVGIIPTNLTTVVVMRIVRGS